MHCAMMALQHKNQLKNSLGIIEAASRILLCIHTNSKGMVPPWIFFKTFDYCQVFNCRDHCCGLNYLDVNMSDDVQHLVASRNIIKTNLPKSINTHGSLRV